MLIAELDHHCGVFLDYDVPQPFHIHTVLRTPHGNDYGRACAVVAGVYAVGLVLIAVAPETKGRPLPE